MGDSNDILTRLRSRIAAVEGHRRAAAIAVPLGHAAIDDVLGGGIGRGQLHEIFAETPGDSGAAGGFAAMLCTLIARPAGTIFWLRERSVEARGGCLHAPGLMALGLDPGRVVLGVMDDPLALLRVAAEVVRCPDVDVAVVELWRMPRALDLTATRRLAVAAQAAETTTLMLRADADQMPSAAQTRWSVASAAAVPLAAEAPGHPTLDLKLLRQRGGVADRGWQVEWHCDEARFRDPAQSGAALSRPVVPLSVGGPVATPGWRRAG